MADLDPAHVEAVARTLHGSGCRCKEPAWKNRLDARLVLESTDPAVHAALLAVPAVREALAVAWQEGYDAAQGMARCYGHTDHWEGERDNPYRGEEVRLD